jgi:hypothetical protein
MGLARVWPLAALVLELIAFVLLTLWLFPSAWDVTNAVFDEDQSAGPELGVTFSEVADHPQPMWGHTVIVSARVKEIVNGRVMLLGNDKPVVGDTVLVVSARHLAALCASSPGVGLSDGDVVQVTGEVRRFDAAALEADLGIELDEIAGYGEEAVLVASAIELNPPVGGGAGDPEFGGSAGPEVGVTIEDIHDHPERYYGRRVAISGEVEHVFGPHAAWVRDKGVVVVRREADVVWFDEVSAFVTGEVRRFDPAALEAELGIDLGGEELLKYAGGPVVVADSIEVIK